MVWDILERKGGSAREERKDFLTATPREHTGPTKNHTLCGREKVQATDFNFLLFVKK